MSKLEKTYYDLELEANERKRVIKLLKPELVPDVETEFVAISSQSLRSQENVLMSGNGIIFC